MTLSPEFVFAVIVALVGGIVWLVRLEAKTNRNDERLEEFKEHREKTFKEFREQYDRDRERLERDFREFRGGPMKIDRLPAREDRDR